MEIYRVKPGSRVDLDARDTRDTRGFDGDKSEGKEGAEEAHCAVGGTAGVALCRRQAEAADRPAGYGYGVGKMGSSVTSSMASIPRASRSPISKSRRQELSITSGGSASGPPGRGEIVIFNRNHYEDVLVVRVHN